MIRINDDAQDWSKALSVGEQQRIAFARILLSRPRVVFLDESTSAMDEGLELMLYELIRAELPETILISVSHRATLSSSIPVGLTWSAAQMAVRSPRPEELSLWHAPSRLARYFSGMEMFTPTLDWGNELVTSLVWIATAWVIAAVCTLVILVLVARYTIWGKQYWRVTSAYFTGRRASRSGSGWPHCCFP